MPRTIENLLTQISMRSTSSPLTCTCRLVFLISSNISLSLTLRRGTGQSSLIVCTLLTSDRTGNELTPSAKYDFKFKDYAPWVFRHLRSTFKLDPADYLVSLTSKYILSELGSPGKSGSFFYFSR